MEILIVDNLIPLKFLAVLKVVLNKKVYISVSEALKRLNLFEKGNFPQILSGKYWSSPRYDSTYVAFCRYVRASCHAWIYLLAVTHVYNIY